MSKLISSLIMLFCLCTLALPQTGNQPCLSSNNVLVEQDKPSIYITFESSGKGKPINSGGSGDYILLRLHNNSRWAITTYAGSSIQLNDKSFSSMSHCGRTLSVLREGTEIDADYYVRSNAEEIKAPIILRHDSLAGEVWLASGSSLLFRIPREHLAKYLNVYVPFKYEWEMYIEEKRPKAKTQSLYEINRYEELRHLVYFHYYQLPEYSR